MNKAQDYDYTKNERQRRFRAKRKQQEQRRMYAAKRASQACDRVMLASSSEEKDQAAKWARAWAKASWFRG